MLATVVFTACSGEPAPTSSTTAGHTWLGSTTTWVADAHDSVEQQEASLYFAEFVDLTGNPDIGRAIVGFNAAALSRTNRVFESIHKMFVSWPNDESKTSQTKIGLGDPSIPQKMGRTPALYAHPIFPWRGNYTGKLHTARLKTQAEDPKAWVFRVEFSIKKATQHGFDLAELVDANQHSDQTLVVAVTGGPKGTADADASQRPRYCEREFPLPTTRDSDGTVVLPAATIPSVADFVAACSAAVVINSDTEPAYELLRTEQDPDKLARLILGIDAYARFIETQLLDKADSNLLEEASRYLMAVTGTGEAAQAHPTALYFLTHMLITIRNISGPAPLDTQSFRLSEVFSLLRSSPHFDKPALKWMEAVAIEQLSSPVEAQDAWRDMQNNPPADLIVASPTYMAAIQAANIDWVKGDIGGSMQKFIALNRKTELASQLAENLNLTPVHATTNSGIRLWFEFTKQHLRPPSAVVSSTLRYALAIHYLDLAGSAEQLSDAIALDVGGLFALDHDPQASVGYNRVAQALLSDAVRKDLGAKLQLDPALAKCLVSATKVDIECQRDDVRKVLLAFATAARERAFEYVADGREALVVELEALCDGRHNSACKRLEKVAEPTRGTKPNVSAQFKASSGLVEDSRIDAQAEVDINLMVALAYQEALLQCNMGNVDVGITIARRYMSSEVEALQFAGPLALCRVRATGRDDTPTFVQPPGAKVKTVLALRGQLALADETKADYEAASKYHYTDPTIGAALFLIEYAMSWGALSAYVEVLQTTDTEEADRAASLDTLWDLTNQWYGSERDPNDPMQLADLLESERSDEPPSSPRKKRTAESQRKRRCQRHASVIERYERSFERIFKANNTAGDMLANYLVGEAVTAYLLIYEKLADEASGCPDLTFRNLELVVATLALEQPSPDVPTLYHLAPNVEFGFVTGFGTLVASGGKLRGIDDCGFFVEDEIEAVCRARFTAHEHQFAALLDESRYPFLADLDDADKRERFVAHGQPATLAEALVWLLQEHGGQGLLDARFFPSYLAVYRLIADGRSGDASMLLQRVLSKHRARPEFRTFAAQTKLMTGNLDGALSTAKGVVARKPTLGGGAASSVLVSVKLRRGMARTSRREVFSEREIRRDLQGVLDAYYNATQHTRGSEQMLATLQLGFILLELGKDKEALAAFEAAHGSFAAALAEQLVTGNPATESIKHLHDYSTLGAAAANWARGRRDEAIRWFSESNAIESDIHAGELVTGERFNRLSRTVTKASW